VEREVAFKPHPGHMYSSFCIEVENISGFTT